MKLHANAALSLKQRRRMVCRVVEQGWSLTKAAAAAEISARVAARVLLVVRCESLPVAAEGARIRPKAGAVSQLATGRRAAWHDCCTVGNGDMGERTHYEPGTFCWVGLATSDPMAATAFYETLFGWRAAELAAGEAGTYTALRHDGKDVAILYRQQPEARAVGAPPHWTSYISVEDADVTAARAGELGGAAVFREPFDVLDAGRVAAIRDPTGAIVSLWQPRSRIGATLVNDVGALCWNELSTPDPEAAAKFYEPLFGWSFEPIATGPGGPEMMGITNSAGWKNGSTTKLEGEMAGIPPNWMPYFGVESCPEAVARARGLDGQVVVDTLEIPTGRLAVLRDPQDAAFGILDGEMDP